MEVSEAVEYIRNKEVKNEEDIKEVMTKVGLNCEALREFPKSLYPYCKKSGLRVWQYPNQFGPYIMLLRSLNIPIKRYLEIGTRWGGTFILTNELLKTDFALGIDLLDIAENLVEYKKHKNFDFYKGNSLTIHFREKIQSEKPFDLALIDGDHKRDAVLYDFDTCHQNNTKIIVCHDIENSSCPTCKDAWLKIKLDFSKDYDFYEFKEQYFPEVKHKYLGIGVAVRKF